MKNILAIVGDYFPYPSSNTNCFEPLLKGLEQNNWHVDVVTVRQWIDLPNYEKQDNGREVWRIDDPRSMNTTSINKLRDIPSSKLLKLFNTCFMVLSKALFYTRYCLGKDDKRFGSWPQEKTVEKCLNLHQVKNYDVVISVSHPVVSHDIAKKFVNMVNGVRPKWILYELDPYCYNEHLYGKNCYSRLAPKQHELFKACDMVAVVTELYHFYLDTPFNIYQEKMVSLNYPNLKPVEIDGQNINNIPLNKNKCTCVFGGALNNGIRSPRYAINTFSKCFQDIEFIIMTGFDLF